MFECINKNLLLWEKCLTTCTIGRKNEEDVYKHILYIRKQGKEHHVKRKATGFIVCVFVKFSVTCACRSKNIDTNGFTTMQKNILRLMVFHASDATNYT